MRKQLYYDRAIESLKNYLGWFYEVSWTF
jgi:hypothetical protein